MRKSSGAEPARVRASLRTPMRKAACRAEKSARGDVTVPSVLVRRAVTRCPASATYSSWNWTVRASFRSTTVSANNASVSPAMSDGTRGVTTINSAVLSANMLCRRAVFGTSTKN